ncbi:hypothetical protein IPA_07705 [Ignicoccus pacificus DSM 13166]|uniref:Thioredoxin-like fold domain-containing protein n=1 Tax=Ignicoccus pacificus DSM 13166 TaxID=940294 RepID=A0A977PLP7_9CREN|nr:hypothetical protein IPA_07705 [Ignicoccus pacificus DSM 13166]
MLEALLKYFGVMDLGEITKEMIKGGKVVIEEYPEGASSKLALLPNVEVVKGQKPDEDWKIPYVKPKGPNGEVTFYGPLEGILLYGMGTLLLYLSGAREPEKFDPLPVPMNLRVYVYPGLPCYFVLKELGRIAGTKNLNIEIIHVDKGKRLQMLYSLGVRSVPTYELNGKLLHNGKLSAEELYELLKKKAEEEVTKMWEKIKKEYIREKQ